MSTRTNMEILDDALRHSIVHPEGGEDSDGASGPTFTSSITEGLPDAEIGDTWAPPEFAPLIVTYGGSDVWVGGLAGIIDVDGVGPVARTAMSVNATGIYLAYNDDDNLPAQMVAIDAEGFHLGDGGSPIVAIHSSSPLDQDPVPDAPAGSIWWEYSGFTGTITATWVRDDNETWVGNVSSGSASSDLLTGVGEPLAAGALLDIVDAFGDNADLTGATDLAAGPVELVVPSEDHTGLIYSWQYDLTPQGDLPPGRRVIGWEIIGKAVGGGYVNVAVQIADDPPTFAGGAAYRDDLQRENNGEYFGAPGTAIGSFFPSGDNLVTQTLVNDGGVSVDEIAGYSLGIILSGGEGAVADGMGFTIKSIRPIYHLPDDRVKARANATAHDVYVSGDESGWADIGYDLPPTEITGALDDLVGVLAGMATTGSDLTVLTLAADQIFTLTDGSWRYWIDLTGGAASVTLPPPADGVSIEISNYVGGNPLTVLPNDSETINGATTIPFTYIAVYECVAGNWYQKSYTTWD